MRSASTANTFKLDSYMINPTDVNTFPWLNEIARCYQEWIPHGIVFIYKTMSADALNSVNTALGTVIMATNYNATQPNYASKAEMENSEFSRSIKPSISCEYPPIVTGKQSSTHPQTLSCR